MRVQARPRFKCLASSTGLALALGAAASPAGAWDGSKAYQTCIEAAGGSDPLMTDCTREEFDREDKRLNRAYAVRMKAAESDLKEAVRASQRAWLSYRDASCAAEASPPGVEPTRRWPRPAAGCA